MRDTLFIEVRVDGEPEDRGSFTLPTMAMPLPAVGEVFTCRFRPREDEDRPGALPLPERFRVVRREMTYGWERRSSMEARTYCSVVLIVTVVAAPADQEAGWP